MKLFITVFSAIIAAAVVIGSALWAISRMNDWERAKQYYHSSILAEWDAVKQAATGFSGLNDAALAVEHAHDQAEARVFQLERELLVIYDNKPFGLPLIEQDRKDRNYIEREIDKQLREDTRRMQRKLEASTPTRPAAGTNQYGTNILAVEPDTSMKPWTTPTPQTNRY